VPQRVLLTRHTSFRQPGCLCSFRSIRWT
jgi:hypothetical protein